MCQYSCETDGVPGDWHLVHLGSRAVGGAALVITEAAAVEPEGRISDGDAGLWNEAQALAFRRISDFIHVNDSLIGVQLAHAGRKASSERPWLGGGPIRDPKRGWPTMGPSPISFDSNYPVPQEMSLDGIEQISRKFENSARLASIAGFDVVELHMAHGYLFHEFLSPLSNHRTDQYGGSLENRMRFSLNVTERVRKIWPQSKPLFVRISATDWTQGGWTIEDSVVFSRELKKLGVDLIDCSTGGNVAHAKIPSGPSYQVPFAERVRKEAEIATGAVGLITDAHQAGEIIKSGKADAVLLARELLRDPYWPLHAARELGVNINWPRQYERAKR